MNGAPAAKVGSRRSSRDRSRGSSSSRGRGAILRALDSLCKSHEACATGQGSLEGEIEVSVQVTLPSDEDEEAENASQSGTPCRSRVLSRLPAYRASSRVSRPSWLPVTCSCRRQIAGVVRPVMKRLLPLCNCDTRWKTKTLGRLEVQCAIVRKWAHTLTATRWSSFGRKCGPLR